VSEDELGMSANAKIGPINNVKSTRHSRDRIIRINLSNLTPGSRRISRA
jgi:hypothetical protein